MLTSIGEFERETIVENVKNGIKQRAKEGGFNGGGVILSTLFSIYYYKN